MATLSNTDKETPSLSHADKETPSLSNADRQGLHSNLWDDNNLPWADDNLPWQDEKETYLTELSNQDKL